MVRSKSALRESILLHTFREVQRRTPSTPKWRGFGLYLTGRCFPGCDSSRFSKQRPECLDSRFENRVHIDEAETVGLVKEAVVETGTAPKFGADNDVVVLAKWPKPCRLGGAKNSDNRYIQSCGYVHGTTVVANQHPALGEDRHKPPQGQRYPDELILILSWSCLAAILEPQYLDRTFCSQTLRDDSEVLLAPLPNSTTIARMYTDQDVSVLNAALGEVQLSPVLLFLPESQTRLSHENGFVDVLKES